MYKRIPGVISKMQWTATLANTKLIVTLDETSLLDILKNIWREFLDHHVKSDYTKRITGSSCSCFKSLRAIQKLNDPSPKNLRDHFILFSGCLMHVDRTVRYRGAKK